MHLNNKNCRLHVKAYNVIVNLVESDIYNMTNNMNINTRSTRHGNIYLLIFREES
jgi:hypothetical protein